MQFGHCHPSEYKRFNVQRARDVLEIFSNPKYAPLLKWSTLDIGQSSRYPKRQRSTPSLEEAQTSLYVNAHTLWYLRIAP